MTAYQQLLAHLHRGRRLYAHDIEIGGVMISTVRIRFKGSERWPSGDALRAVNLDTKMELPYIAVCAIRRWLMETPEIWSLYP